MSHLPRLYLRMPQLPGCHERAEEAELKQGDCGVSVLDPMVVLRYQAAYIIITSKFDIHGQRCCLKRKHDIASRWTD